MYFTEKKINILPRKANGKGRQGKRTERSCSVGYGHREQSKTAHKTGTIDRSSCHTDRDGREVRGDKAWAPILRSIALNTISDVLLPLSCGLRVY
jgi:hypothetical protein